jgi:uncharacterized membrane protein
MRDKPTILLVLLFGMGFVTSLWYNYLFLINECGCAANGSNLVVILEAPTIIFFIPLNYWASIGFGIALILSMLVLFFNYAKIKLILIIGTIVSGIFIVPYSIFLEINLFNRICGLCTVMQIVIILSALYSAYFLMKT